MTKDNHNHVRKLYADVDPTRYDPAKATTAEIDRARREQIDAVAGPPGHDLGGVQADRDRGPSERQVLELPGKESIPGYIHVYGRGDTMVVTDASERIDGESLFVKLVLKECYETWVWIVGRCEGMVDFGEVRGVVTWENSD